MRVVGRFDIKDGISGVFVQGESLIPGLVAYPEVRDRVRILESGSVNHLYLINENDLPVIIIDGEALEGGKQNRTLRFALVLEKGEHKIPVFCIEEGRWGGRYPGEVDNLRRAVESMDILMEVAEYLCGSQPYHRRVYGYIADLSMLLLNELKSGGRHLEEIALLVKVFHLLFIYRGLRDPRFIYIAGDVPDEVHYLSADELRSILHRLPVSERYKQSILRKLSQVDGMELPEAMRRVRRMRIGEEEICDYAFDLLGRYRRFYLRRMGEIRPDHFSRAGVLPHAFRMMYLGADQGKVWGTVNRFMRMEGVDSPTFNFIEVIEKRNRKLDIPRIEVPSPATSVIFLKDGVPLMMEEIASPRAFRAYFPHLLGSFLSFYEYLEPRQRMDTEEFLSRSRMEDVHREYRVSHNLIREGKYKRETLYSGVIPQKTKDLGVYILAHRVVYNAVVRT